jgi:hypothetical protein
MKQYVQTDLAADRQVANVLAELMAGGSLASVDITEQNSSGNEGEAARPAARLLRLVYKSVYKPPAGGHGKGLGTCPPGLWRATFLVAGAGFEPATSGL